MFGYRITTKYMNLVIQKNKIKMATEILQNHFFFGKYTSSFMFTFKRCLLVSDFNHLKILNSF